MQSVKLAFKGMKKHIIRTIITILLFGFALGAIACGIAYPICDLEGNYSAYLNDNGITNLRISFDSTKHSLQELKELFPEGQKFYPVRRGSNAALGISTLYNLKYGTELAALGLSMAEGQLPNKKDEIALSDAVYRDLQKNGIACFVTSGSLQPVLKKFNTFAEAKEIFATRSPFPPSSTPEYAKNYILSGVIDTGYDFDKVAEWERGRDAAADDTAKEDFDRLIAEYHQNSAYKLAFEISDDQKVLDSDEFLTAVPEKLSDTSAFFGKLRADTDEIFYHRIFQHKSRNNAFFVNEINYDDGFIARINMGNSFFILLLPVGIIFLIIALFMSVALESMCLKSMRDEIGTLRALGMSGGKVFLLSVIRGMVVAVIAFGCSVAFAYLIERLFFPNAAALAQQRGAKGWGNIVNVFAFLTTFALSAVISLLSSALGHARYLRKNPSEILRQNKE